MYMKSSEVHNLIWRLSPIQTDRKTAIRSVEIELPRAGVIIARIEISIFESPKKYFARIFPRLIKPNGAKASAEIFDSNVLGEECVYVRFIIYSVRVCVFESGKCIR